MDLPRLIQRGGHGRSQRRDRRAGSSEGIAKSLRDQVRVVENVERSSKMSQRDPDGAVKEIRREADIAMKEIRRYSDTTIKELNQEMTRSQKETLNEIRTLRRELDDKIKKALDNPLAK